MTLPTGRKAIESEMARQQCDALASFEAAKSVATDIATSLQATGQLTLLGMGGSHCVGRTVEPLYRSLGIDAVAMTFSEQLDTGRPSDGKTIIATSQSGESAEAVRWLSEAGQRDHCFGMTMEGASTLTISVPCLIGCGGSEIAVAATRSFTIAFAQHLAVLTALGVDPTKALAALSETHAAPLEEALAHFGNVTTVITCGRRVRGLAEGLALGIAELARLPSFAIEGGQMRHGPLEMLGPDRGVVLVRSNETGGERFDGLASAVRKCRSPVIAFDCSGGDPIADAVNIRLPKSSDMAAVFFLLPILQRFMLEFGNRHVADVGTPMHIAKVTRVE
ncbi:SIS domain-containing protein [Sinorhizobium meliloti]|uniref:Glutamine--fructose-6-phosphate aminotransferase [isomerizing] n=1 Tax=Rhizobium meliloti TaxID=382 RepID=A0AAW9TJJ2_RHIML|nr:aminotransferase [Sinorhizobium meliloti]MQW32678.1 aminotransferase [Sinorhizobium meliloti]